MDLHALDISQLMDILAKYTIEYTKMLAAGSPQEEYLKCKEAIKAIQAEIELRQSRETDAQTLGNNITTPPEFS